MRWIASASLALSLVLLFGTAVAAGAAKPTTLTGTLGGAQLPAAGKGVVAVRALHLPDGRVLAGTYASRRGRFTLKPPGGSYAVLVSVVPAPGSGTKPVERVTSFVTAKPGKRVVVRATPRQRRHRRARRVTARAAFQHVSYLALWVRQWQVPPGELQVMRRGMANMLITDLAPVVERCGGGIFDRDAWDLLLAEQRLQQDPRFDPASRVQTGRLVVPNATLDGRITVTGSTMTLTATFHDQRTGRRATASVSGSADTLFDLEQALVRKLERVICVQTPQTYAGTFTGTATSRLNQYTISWSGSLMIELQDEHGTAPTGWPAGDYAQYVIKSGSAHVKLDGTRGVCAAHGETDLDLAAAGAPPAIPPAIPGFSGPVPRLPALPVAAVQVDARGDDEPVFSLNVPAPSTATIPYQETGVGCQTDPQYPLTGIQLVYTPRPLRASAGALTGSPSWDPPDGFSHLQFGFSLSVTG
jgi:hypothetical protein